MEYDMIDRFLRNNLGDDDYAEYSAALDSLCTPQPKEAAQCTNSDSWNCKYCTKNQTCEAINDHRNFGEPKEQEKNTTCGEPVELNKFGIQKLLKQSGFDNATPEETAAFISGIRHREAEMLDTTPPQSKKTEQKPVALEAVYETIIQWDEGGGKRSRRELARRILSLYPDPKCNPHPKAPHGFDRSASHANDRYVCECEGWNAYDAGYEDGMIAGIEASMEQQSEQEPLAWAEWKE